MNEMKKVLIATRLQLREELSTIIDWNKYGYEVMNEAENEWEISRILENQSIDLLVTEMSDEGASNLQLMHKVQVMVITNRDEVDTIKREKLCGAGICLQQPIVKEKVMQALEQIERMKEEERKIQEIKQKYEQLEFENSIIHLVLGKYTQKELIRIRKKLSDKTSWQYIELEFNRMTEHIPLEKKVQIENSFINYIRESEKEYSKAVVVVPNLNKNEFGIGLLFDLKRLKNRNMSSYEYVTYLRRRLLHQFKINIQIYIGKEVEGLEHITESYDSIHEVRWLHAFAENKEWLEDYKVRTNIEIRGQIEKGLVDELILAVEQGDQEAISELVDKLYVRLYKNVGVKEIFEANLAYFWCRLVDLSTKISWENNYNKIKWYLDFEGFRQLMLWGKREGILSYLEEFSEYIRHMIQNETKGILVRIEEYIQENYKQNISLKLLGEKFYINNVYLGQLFKKKYGLYFRDYMNRLRIEKSTVLLKTTNMRVYEIAKEVGFHNTDYFINKFVQFQGITPQQYRMKQK